MVPPYLCKLAATATGEYSAPRHTVSASDEGRTENTVQFWRVGLASFSRLQQPVDKDEGERGALVA